jgi:hypothetical protein
VHWVLWLPLKCNTEVSAIAAHILLYKCQLTAHALVQEQPLHAIDYTADVLQQIVARNANMAFMSAQNEQNYEHTGAIHPIFQGKRM